MIQRYKFHMHEADRQHIYLMYRIMNNQPHIYIYVERESLNVCLRLEFGLFDKNKVHANVQSHRMQTVYV